MTVDNDSQNGALFALEAYNIALHGLQIIFTFY